MKCYNENNTDKVSEPTDADLLVEREVLQRFVGGVKTALKHQGVLTARTTILKSIKTLEDGEIHKAVRLANGLK